MRGQDIVYQNGKPIFGLLRLLGVLPITRTTPGVTVFKMGSASMAYSIFIFVLVLVSELLERIENANFWLPYIVNRMKTNSYVTLFYTFYFHFYLNGNQIRIAVYSIVNML